jgi:hypothetical protein
MPRLFLCGLLGCLLSACALTTSRAPRPLRDGARASSDVLAAEEIARTHVLTAYEAVQRLRPQFLGTRGADILGGGGSEGPAVYLNGLLMGGVEQLHHIPAAEVLELRHLSAIQATLEFGIGHSAGAIVVRTGAQTSRPWL